MNRNRHFKLLLMATLVLVLGLGATLAFAQSGPADAQQASMSAPFLVSYQGRVTVDGEPFDGVGYFKFAFVDSQGRYVWTNDMPVQALDAGQQLGPPQRAVDLLVSNGLFSVLLGDTSLDMQPIIPPVFYDPDTKLRVWFSPEPGGPFQQLPDRPLASAPYALVAEDAVTLQGEGPNAFASATHDHWGETWTGNGTGLTLHSNDGVGLRGQQGASASVPPIAGAGIWGDSADHPGVWGSSADAAGVVGISAHDTGVAGLATSNDGVGIQGVAPVTGTVGIATNSNGLAYGVYGKSDSDSGIGVYGEGGHIGVEGEGEYGVRGWSDDTGGIGVYGRNSAGSGSGIGVYGRSDSPDGSALYGLAAGGGYGLYTEGDAHVEGELTWSKKTSYLSIAPAAFVPHNTGYFYSQEGKFLVAFSDDSPDYYATVSLPHGATVTRVTCAWVDASIDQDVTCALYRSDLFGSSIEMAEVVSSGSSGSDYGADVTIEVPKIDNSNYIYYMEVDLPALNLALSGVIIEYTFTEPY